MAKPTNAAIVDLKGRTWNPFESKSASGYVTYDDKSGEIHVPYGTDPVSTTIQAHELTHVRYTAKVWPDIKRGLTRLTRKAGTTSAIVGYAEDMRGQALAGRLGVKTLPVFGDKDDQPIIDRWVESFVEAGIPEARVQRAVRFILNEHTSVLGRMGLKLDKLQEPANAERYITYAAGYLHKLLSKGIDDSPPKTEDGGKADPESKGEKGKSSKSEKSEKAPAEKSEAPEGEGDDAEGDSGKSEESDKGSKGDSEGDEAGEGAEGDGADASEGQAEGDASGTPGGGAEGARSSEKEVDLSEVALPDVREAMMASVPAPVDVEKLIQNFQHTLDTANWIPVPTIERVPLVRRAAIANRKGRKLSETGVALGSAYDAVAPNERRPFMAKRKGGAGGLTVVIDCSGSMNISEKQIETLLTAHPQGVVVTYSSHVGWGSGEDRAVVRVIASHGRLAAQASFRDRRAGGNGCDGPMLEWLARQSGERVWVCDGLITGKGDSGVAHDPQARAAWLKAHRITQFKSLGLYLESLT